MHIQFDVSQVRSHRNRWSASSGSVNSTQMRGMSSGTSATGPAYADPSRRSRTRSMSDNGARDARASGCRRPRCTPRTARRRSRSAGRLGYDGVEVMVWTDPVTQEPGAIQALSDLHGLPVLSIHAPTLLLTQRVWGTDPWEKVDRSIDMALTLGAPTVVAAPAVPLAAGVRRGLRRRDRRSARRRPASGCRREHVPVAGRGSGRCSPTCRTGTRWTSPTTTSPSTSRTPRPPAPTRWRWPAPWATGSRTSTSPTAAARRGTSTWYPDAGPSRAASCWNTWRATVSTGSIVVEVSTRRLVAEVRELDLAEALAFARLHFAAVAQP